MENKIKDLRAQLGSLGYHEFQINAIIKDCIGKSAITNLSPQESQELIDSLENHIQFAVKCRSKKNK